MKEIKLPSGAQLKIANVPFAEAKELFQAVLEEMKELKIETSTNMDVNFFKNIFCSGLSSKKIEKALGACLKRCTYNDLKIDQDTFEPMESRSDYLPVVFEVLGETVAPFFKNLTVLSNRAVLAVEGLQK